MKSRLGFTLIELLIVIAIIAILALIAVPNFIDAQARSKVSRVRADMRSLATAIEAYQVDNNVYPIGDWEMSAWTPHSAPMGISGDNKADWAMIRRWCTLTTPIAYMTTVPFDPFNLHNVSVNPATQPDHRMYRYYRYDRMARYHIQGYDGTSYTEAPGAIYYCFQHGMGWAMHSFGPARRRAGHDKSKTYSYRWHLAGLPDDATHVGYPNMAYDPTNGTVSFGYLFRTSQGGDLVRN